MDLITNFQGKIDLKLYSYNVDFSLLDFLKRISSE